MTKTSDPIFEVLRQIASTTSLKEKEAIVSAAKDSILKQVFFFTENGGFNYYIRANEQMIKSIEALPEGEEIIKAEHLQIFADLNARKVTGDAARQAFMNVCKKMTAGSRSVMIRILNRDLRVNAGTAIANKVWKGLIPEMPQMLARKMDAKVAAKITTKKNGYIVQRKCDGGRCITRVDVDGITMKSRGNNTLDLHGVMDEALSRFRGYVVDGELLVRGKNGVEDRKTGNGLYTKAVRGTLTREEAERFTYVVWEMVPIDEYRSGGEYKVPYSERLKMLSDLIKKEKTDKISLIDGKIVSSIEEVDQYYQEMLAKGEEGAILKFADMPWEDTRSKFMIKLKEEKTADLKVVGEEEGTGKYAGMLGALICETRDGQLRTNVGSGFSDDQRVLGKYVGSVVEVKYNALIKAKGRDSTSMFLPIFSKIRYDKQVANSLNELA